MGERMQLRRRLRQQRRAREAMLLDLGALVYELHRQGRRAPELLQQKAAELEVVDGEVRELEDALAGIAPEGEEAFAEAEPLEGTGEWAERELGDEEFDDDEHEPPLDDEFDDADSEDDHLEDEGEDEAEDLDADELDEDEYEDDLDQAALHAEPAPTVEVDALDDDPGSPGEARS